MRGEPHNRHGHLHTCRLDQEDICTHYGQHNRVVTFLPQYDERFNATTMYARIDREPRYAERWDAGDPTIEQVLDVARKHDGLKGTWEIATIEEWDSGKCVELHFTQKGD